MFDILFLLLQEQHNSHKCCCNDPIITTYTAIVTSPNDAWGGAMPYVKFIPHNVEFKQCPYIKLKRGTK